MTLLSGVIDNLRARLTNLDQDFRCWLSRSEASEQLEQHHTQIRRITRILNGMIEFTFSETPLQNDTATADLKSVPDLRRAVGSMHVIWEFFRDKFAQRDVQNVASHLSVADDFAWELYKPFLDAAKEADSLNGESVAEPPLVFFSPFRSPYAQARTKQFQPPGIDAKDFQQFQEILMAIPIPVVGVPWASANRLPDLVVVGHETGHIVAEDLGLALESEVALSNLDYPNDDGSRKKCWRSWSDEVFADVFGVLATGQAFVTGLASELVDQRSEIRFADVNKDSPGAYPTPTLRIAICHRVLELSGVTPDDSWDQAYGGLTGDSESFEDDVNLVVDTLLNQQWTALGSKELGQLLPWNAAREAHADSIRSRVIGGSDPTGPFSVRNWIAGAMAAFQSDPATYLELNLDQVLAEQIVAQRTVGVRSSHTETLRSGLLFDEDALLEAGTDVQEAADQAMGRELAKRMSLLSSP